LFYLVEMEARRFFDFDGIVPSCLMLQNIEQDKKEIQYFWECNSVEAQCPFCGILNYSFISIPSDPYGLPVQ